LKYVKNINEELGSDIDLEPILSRDL